VTAKSASTSRKLDVTLPITTLLDKAKLDLSLKIGPLAPVAAVAFSPDDTILAVGTARFPPADPRAPAGNDALADATAQTTAVSGTRPARLIVRNAIVVDGNGTPAKGPFDIVLENGTITQLIALDPVALGRNGAGRRARADANTVEIDATGKYVLPGLINAHAHLQDERGGTAQAIDYELKVWLACGITAIRDVGSDTRKALAWREASAKGTLAAPRIFIYPQFGRPTNADSARARVRLISRTFGAPASHSAVTTARAPPPAPRTTIGPASARQSG